MLSVETSIYIILAEIKHYCEFHMIPLKINIFKGMK